MGTFRSAVSNNVNNIAPLTITLPSAVLSGDLLVCYAGINNGTTAGNGPYFTISDSSTNTRWKYITGITYSGGVFSWEMYYCWNAAASGSLAVTMTLNSAGIASGATQCNGNALDFSGVQSSADPLDGFAIAGNTAGNTYFATSSFVPTRNGTAVCGYYDTANSSSPPVLGQGYAGPAGGFDPTNPNAQCGYKASRNAAIVGDGTGVGGFNNVIAASFTDAAVDLRTLAYADLARQTSTTSGTGTLTLNGNVTGYAPLSVAFVSGQLVYYTITDGGSAYETGAGTWNGVTSALSRDVVFASSNGGALVNFSSAAKAVWCELPALASADIGQALALRDAATTPQ